MAEFALNVNNLTKRFGNITALDCVSLSVKRGDTFGLLGPNGAGKSTLINIISGVLAYDSGDLEIFGERISVPTQEMKMKLGVIPQEISLYDKLTARENLEFYGNLYGIERGKLRAKINSILELVGLTDRQNDRIKTYSGGMKRRINIAASVLHEPEFILMDEPTVGIDPQSRNLIFEVIESLHEKGVTIIYTSHYMEEVERLCHDIAIVDHGRVIANGTKEELIALIGGVDVIEIEVDQMAESGREKVREMYADMSPKFVDGRIFLNTKSGGIKLGEIITRINSTGTYVKNAHVREPNLENVFLHLTGKELRD